MATRRGTAGRSALQNAALLFGAIFLVVAIAGFIPGLTTQYGRLDEFSGPGAKVLGIFGVNLVENLAHLLYAIAGFALASTWERARTYFIAGGAIYLVLWIYGLIIDINSSANFLGVNEPANWLHFALGVVMLGVGLVLGRAPERRALAA